MVQIYSREEAFEASLKYFNGNKLSADVFLDKYALKNEKGELLEKTPTDMHHRLAKEFARIEAKKFKKPMTEEEIFGLFDQFANIIPQGSPMYGIGNPYQIASISNCFVIPSPNDSYGSILKTDEQIVQVSKRRGGVGVNVSNLRPRGATVKNAARSSTGAISFVKRYSNSIREVGQDGRRGALLVAMNIHHPESVIPWDESRPEFVTRIKDNEGADFEVSSKYYDPDNIDFATCKYDKKQVTGANLSLQTTDEFMNAVVEQKDYEQRWPTDKNNVKISKKVDANKVWDKIIYSAWRTGDPGLLFWDTVLRESIPDCYAKFGFGSTATNPCITAETLVYVADGRGNVSIGELAKSGKDVPVFCRDNEGKIVIRTMRNPRITGKKKKIFKVTLDDGFVVRTTENHKFLLKTGEYKKVKDLVVGDSLDIITRYEASIKEIFSKANSSSQDYWWINNGKKSSYAEHRIIAANFFGEIKSGEVVHHKDFDASNNSLDNLEILTKEEHDALHSANMIGDKNPMRRAKTEWSEAKWMQYRENLSLSVSGEKNGRYSGFSNEEIGEKAISLVKSLGRRFSIGEWSDFAKKNSLPITFSEFRRAVWESPIELGYWACEKSGISEGIELDVRTQRILNNAMSQGYHSKIIGNYVCVQKTCEICGNDFWVRFERREQAVCGHSCSNILSNRNGIKEKRANSINETYKNLADENRQKQMDVFACLKNTLGREPKLFEWEKSCEEKGIAHRLKTKYGFQNFEELREGASMYNHRVISIVEDGEEDVYNGTVDDFHNFYIGGFAGITRSGKKKMIYLNNLQCGEIILSPYDSCRLLVLNLWGFMRNAFTKEAYFDYKAFYEAAQKAQRLADDLIDLELEAVNKILEKIEKDPEDDKTKEAEVELWKNVIRYCELGRRTGTGITALGNVISGLGLRYGSQESIDFVEKMYRTLKFGTYRASVNMAKEIGSFEVFDHELEKNNPFLLRFKNEKIELNGGDIVDGEVLWNDIKKFGRRNIALLTTAPTGSVSIVAKLTKHFGTSSGIEPEFEYKIYTRRKKINQNDQVQKVDFVDETGDKWTEYEVMLSVIKEYVDVTGNKDIDKSPFYKSGANDIDWMAKIKMQAAAQRNICHSISVTYNLPNDVKLEEVKKLYEAAWKNGLKGITIYRDGCKSGVLVRKNDKTSGKEVENSGDASLSATKRPKSLPCDVHHIKVTKKLDKARQFEYIVAIGLLNNKPYEVFAFENGKVDKKFHKGNLIKEGRGKYHLELTDENGEVTLLKNITVDTSEHEDALTRMVSMSLRHAVPIEYVVQQLEKSSDSGSFNKALVRGLKKYIADGAKVAGENCPTCQAALQRREGCKTCPSCGWAACG